MIDNLFKDNFFKIKLKQFLIRYSYWFKSFELDIFCLKNFNASLFIYLFCSQLAPTAL